MLGGIVFQLGKELKKLFPSPNSCLTLLKLPGVITVFSFCFIEYFVRYAKHAPIRDGSIRGKTTRKMKVMIMAVAFVTLLLFIRCVINSGRRNSFRILKIYNFRSIYRTIELADGWAGRIITTERYFSA